MEQRYTVKELKQALPKALKGDQYAQSKLMDYYITGNHNEEEMNSGTWEYEFGNAESPLKGFIGQILGWGHGCYTLRLSYAVENGWFWIENPVLQDFFEDFEDKEIFLTEFMEKMAPTFDPNCYEIFKALAGDKNAWETVSKFTPETVDDSNFPFYWNNSKLAITELAKFFGSYKPDRRWTLFEAFFKTCCQRCLDHIWIIGWLPTVASHTTDRKIKC